jgi:ABC-type phosphate transport system substrate-binding protein
MIEERLSMFSNINLTRIAKAASVAALTVGIAFAVEPVQKTSAQDRLLEGAGTRAIAIPELIEAWFAPSEYANYTPISTGIAREWFETGTVPIDFVSTTFFEPQQTTFTSDIVTINPIDIRVALPYNTDFNGDGLNDFALVLNQQEICGILLGQIQNWNELDPSYPDAPIRRVVREDLGSSIALPSGITTALSTDFVEPVCGVPLTPDTIGFDRAQDIATFYVITSVASTVGTIGYADLSATLDFGFPVDFQNPSDRITNTFVSFVGAPELNIPGGVIIAQASNYFGFYSVYATPEVAERARLECDYLKNSGREFAISEFSYAPPSFPELGDCNSITDAGSF